MTWPELAVLCVWLALFELMRWQRYEHKLRRDSFESAKLTTGEFNEP